MVSIRLALAVAVVLVVLALSAEAAYRKPPFNGSIFGKRSSSITDYEITNRAITAVCELASETCGAWMSRQETN